MLIQTMMGHEVLHGKRMAPFLRPELIEDAEPFLPPLAGHRPDLFVQAWFTLPVAARQSNPSCSRLSGTENKGFVGRGRPPSVGALS